MHSLQRLLLLQCCGHEHSSNPGLLVCSAALALCEADHSLAFVFSFAERVAHHELQIAGGRCTPCMHQACVLRLFVVRRAAAVYSAQATKSLNKGQKESVPIFPWNEPWNQQN
jgi:hypothetical protein